ncbi:MAG: SDR family oxidoreductase [Rhodospirillales bacterium]|nr:SDR family oxidoreductase [Rhodospirillales bacterium]
MDLGLKGKRALILASAGGLGGGVAETLAAEGARVALFDFDRDKLAAHAAHLATTYGGDVEFFVGDIGDLDRLEEVRAETQSRFGGIDILVNNTPGPRPGPLQGVTDPDVWRKQFEVMVLSIIELSRRVLPGMKERHWGRILTLASSSVIQPIPHLTISNVLRSALVGWSKTLAGELAADGITVNMVVPGRIHTDRVDQIDAGIAAKAGKTVDEIRVESLKLLPMGRFGTVDEFASVVAFLAGERASYVSGSMVRVDGAMIRSV